MKTSGNVPYSEREELTFSLGNNISWSGGGDGHGGGENAAPRKKIKKPLSIHGCDLVSNFSEVRGQNQG